MRKIKITWDLATDALTVDSFENISRDTGYELLLFIVRKSAPESLPAGALLLAHLKASPAGAVLSGVTEWTPPAEGRLEDPYKGVLIIGGDEVEALFAPEGAEAELLTAKMLFQLTHRPEEDAPPSKSAILEVVVSNDLERDGDLVVPGTPENPYGLTDVRYLRHDIVQGLDNDGKVRARANAGVVAASVTVEGLVELATSEETVTGTDAGRAVTPAGLAAALEGLGGGGAVYPLGPVFLESPTFFSLADHGRVFFCKVGLGSMDFFCLADSTLDLPVGWSVTLVIAEYSFSNLVKINADTGVNQVAVGPGGVVDPASSVTVASNAGSKAVIVKAGANSWVIYGDVS